MTPPEDRLGADLPSESDLYVRSSCAKVQSWLQKPGDKKFDGFSETSAFSSDPQTPAAPPSIHSCSSYQASTDDGLPGSPFERTRRRKHNRRERRSKTPYTRNLRNRLPSPLQDHLNADLALPMAPVPTRRPLPRVTLRLPTPPSEPNGADSSADPIRRQRHHNGVHSLRCADGSPRDRVRDRFNARREEARCMPLRLRIKRPAKLRDMPADVSPVGAATRTDMATPVILLLPGRGTQRTDHHSHESLRIVLPAPPTAQATDAFLHVSAAPQLNLRRSARARAPRRLGFSPYPKPSTTPAISCF
jgi:hypothetical protein